MNIYTFLWLYKYFWGVICAHFQARSWHVLSLSMVLCFILFHRISHWTLTQLGWLTNSYEDLPFNVPLSNSHCSLNDCYCDSISWVLVRLRYMPTHNSKDFSNKESFAFIFTGVLVEYKIYSTELHLEHLVCILNGHDILASEMSLFCKAFLVEIGGLGYVTWSFWVYYDEKSLCHCNFHVLSHSSPHSMLCSMEAFQIQELHCIFPTSTDTLV